MSTVPAKQDPGHGVGGEYRGEISAPGDSLWRTRPPMCLPAATWSPTPAFQEIVALGPAVIPRLPRTGETHGWSGTGRYDGSLAPIPCHRAICGNIDKAAETWLRWGKEHGYEW